MHLENAVRRIGKDLLRVAGVMGDGRANQNALHNRWSSLYLLYTLAGQRTSLTTLPAVWRRHWSGGCTPPPPAAPLTATVHLAQPVGRPSVGAGGDPSRGVQTVTNAFAALGLENIEAWHTRARPTSVPAALVGPTATASAAVATVPATPAAPKAFGHSDYIAFLAGTQSGHKRCVHPDRR